MHHRYIYCSQLKVPQLGGELGYTHRLEVLFPEGMVNVNRNTCNSSEVQARTLTATYQDEVISVL